LHFSQSIYGRREVSVSDVTVCEICGNRPTVVKLIEIALQLTVYCSGGERNGHEAQRVTESKGGMNAYMYSIRSS